MLYDAADRLKRELERLTNWPVLGDGFLELLGVDRDTEPIFFEEDEQRTSEGDGLLGALGVDRDTEPIVFEEDEQLSSESENVTAARFFVPDIPQVAARRAQRWNQINTWPSLDLDRPGNIVNWGGELVRTDVPQFDDIEDTIYCCLGLVDWEVGAEEQQDSDERRAQFGQEHLCWARFT
jgi:hypothetical protein